MKTACQTRTRPLGTLRFTAITEFAAHTHTRHARAREANRPQGEPNSLEQPDRLNHPVPHLDNKPLPQLNQDATKAAQRMGRPQGWCRKARRKPQQAPIQAGKPTGHRRPLAVVAGGYGPPWLAAAPAGEGGESDAGVLPCVERIDYPQRRGRK